MKAKKPRQNRVMHQFSNTAKELQLETAWVTYAHDPLSKELYARRRYLGWMNSHWKERLAREKKAVMNAVAANDSKTKSLRSLGANFYEATDTWFTNAWTLGVDSYADRSLIDEPKLKAAKKAFKKEGKAFDKAMRRLKIETSHMVLTPSAALTFLPNQPFQVPTWSGTPISDIAVRPRFLSTFSVAVVTFENKDSSKRAAPPRVTAQR